MADTLDAFARDCRRLARGLHGPVLDRVTEHASMAAKKESLKTAGGILGSDLRAHNFAKGRKFGVGYDLVAPGRSTINFRPKGGWVLFDVGASPHLIGSGRRRTARGRVTGKQRRQVLNIGGHIVTGPVRHPGMRGKRMFTRAVDSMNKVVPDAVANAYLLEMHKVVR